MAGLEMTANPKGADAEDYAAKILTEMEYKILARNFHSRYGEIDIIAQNDDIIAFIEVKSRRKNSMVSGFESVGRTKQRKIIATALWYIKINNCGLQPRFDVFSIITDGGKALSHDYLEGAFDSGAYYSKCD